MKKTEYMAPEMEVIELKMNTVLLAGSGETPEPGQEIPGEGPDE